MSRDKQRPRPDVATHWTYHHDDAAPLGLAFLNAVASPFLRIPRGARRMPTTFGEDGTWLVCRWDLPDGRRLTIRSSYEDGVFDTTVTLGAGVGRARSRARSWATLWATWAARLDAITKGGV